MVYPGTNNGGYGSVGNTVIFGHSSYFKSDDGRYQTHFQKIIELEVGEEIWIYQRQGDGNYQRYRYMTSASYDTKPTDVSVLDPGVGKNLTLFTCTPIGNITGRWIVQAKYIDEEKDTLETYLLGKLLTDIEKRSIMDSLKSLKTLSVEAKKKSLREKFEALSLEKRTPSTRYALLQIAKAYGELQ